VVEPQWGEKNNAQNSDWADEGEALEKLWIDLRSRYPSWKLEEFGRRTDVVELEECDVKREIERNSR